MSCGSLIVNSKTPKDKAMQNKSNFIGFVILLAVILVPSVNLFGRVSENGEPPPWAPAHGYRAKTRHIYFPEYNFYFDLQKNVYIYLSEERWQVSLNLPSIYANINLKDSFTVELEIETDTPQIYNVDHIVKYKNKGKGQNPNARGNGAGRNQ